MPGANTETEFEWVKVNLGGGGENSWILLIGNIKSGSEGFTLNLPSTHFQWRLFTRKVQKLRIETVSAVSCTASWMIFTLVRQRNRKADDFRRLCSPSSSSSRSSCQRIDGEFQAQFQWQTEWRTISVVSAQFYRSSFHWRKRKVEKS